MELLLGTEAVTIRPIEPTDASLLVAFHERQRKAFVAGLSECGQHGVGIS